MENYVKKIFSSQPYLIDLFKQFNKTKKIVLDIVNWHKFRLSEIFEFQKIKKFLSRPKNNGDIPYITSTSFDQGVDCYITTNNKISNVITISTNGVSFSCFYHDDFNSLFNLRCFQFLVW